MNGIVHGAVFSHLSYDGVRLVVTAVSKSSRYKIAAILQATYWNDFLE